jgi:hypothetical protein
MNNLILKDIKNIYENYFILIIIIIFVSIYFIINYNKVMANSFSSIDFVQPILITSIVVLIVNLVVFPNENDDDFDSSDHNIYKIYNENTNEPNNKDVEDFEDLKEQKIYKILNDNQNDSNNQSQQPKDQLRDYHKSKNNSHHHGIKLNNDDKKIKKYENKSDSDDKFLNKNIFLPYKNKNVKFQLKT